MVRAFCTNEGEVGERFHPPFFFLLWSVGRSQSIGHHHLKWQRCIGGEAEWKVFRLIRKLATWSSTWNAVIWWQRRWFIFLFRRRAIETWPPEIPLEPASHVWRWCRYTYTYTHTHTHWQGAKVHSAEAIGGNLTKTSEIEWIGGGKSNKSPLFINGDGKASITTITHLYLSTICACICVHVFDMHVTPPSSPHTIFSVVYLFKIYKILLCIFRAFSLSSVCSHIQRHIYFGLCGLKLPLLNPLLQL